MTELMIDTERVDVGGAMSCGFRQDWISGSADDVTFKLSAGAGVGSPWLLLQVKLADGTSRYERVDIRKVTQTWVERILTEEGVT